MKLFVVATRADQGSDRLLVLGQELPVGTDEGMRGGRGSLQGAQTHLQRGGGSRQIRRRMITVLTGARGLGRLTRPGEDGGTEIVAGVRRGVRLDVRIGHGRRPEAEPSDTMRCRRAAATSVGDGCGIAV
ncbi:hypothetical protein PR002_g33046 [Phytophthora rubi]|uniref:Uncharacterized protein n=1 Tax=Phytophthora rubi TaxID=129364 RepID=A0A6A3G397_9STRA|nr:hypothetical protein PR002_g33046 [Phytophthora rubi]